MDWVGIISCARRTLLIFHHRPLFPHSLTLLQRRIIPDGDIELACTVVPEAGLARSSRIRLRRRIRLSLGAAAWARLRRAYGPGGSFVRLG